MVLDKTEYDLLIRLEETGMISPEEATRLDELKSVFESKPLKEVKESRGIVRSLIGKKKKDEPKPVVVYEQPARAGPEIDPDTMAAFAEYMSLKAKMTEIMPKRAEPVCEPRSELDDAFARLVDALDDFKDVIRRAIKNNR